MDKTKCIAVAIRQYFCNVNGFEQEVYQKLTEFASFERQAAIYGIDENGELDFTEIHPDIVIWSFFETETAHWLLGGIDCLADDMFFSLVE